MPSSHSHPSHPSHDHDTSHVHETEETLADITLTPAHARRTETERFRATRAAILADDEACFVCGVRPSDLRDPARSCDPRLNPFGATRIEAHHVVIERSLANGVDPERLAVDYPSVRNFATVEEWADSRFNNCAYCDQCHRLAAHAIHHTLWCIVLATKYALRDADGRPYQFAARSEAEAQVAEVRDEAIEAPVEALLGRLAAHTAPKEPS